ncbi:MAG TPA: carbon-phosphorus lyase complex subunit PhnI [Spirochaetia bacterium]|nr:carbon-phosphorus lyase complex subunit PhnI [Spirochaetia bacterium]
MGYVAVQGGVTAIENSQKLNQYLRLKGHSAPLSVRQIIEQLGPLVDRVMSEGGLYSPFHAALAIKQASGDPIEAAFLLRAYRSTLRRLQDSLSVRTEDMRIQRRISAAFKTIPGGQVLGSTSDYEQRILDFSLAEETAETQQTVVDEFEAGLTNTQESLDPAHFRRVVGMLREQGLVPPVPTQPGAQPTDITQESATFPMDRSGRLQMLARAETGGVLALAYSSMRGYGNIHPTVGELRVGSVSVQIPHPWRKGALVTLGSVSITEVEIVAAVERSDDETKPAFTLGYGACFGHNEVKAISLGVLDRAMRSRSPHAPAEDQEFVLLHTDGVESSGFCSHFKLPHYVTFQADLDRLRAQQGGEE